MDIDIKFHIGHVHKFTQGSTACTLEEKSVSPVECSRLWTGKHSPWISLSISTYSVTMHILRQVVLCRSYKQTHNA
jgi:hypothetical protein